MRAAAPGLNRGKRGDDEQPAGYSKTAQVDCGANSDRRSKYFGGAAQRGAWGCAEQRKAGVDSEQADHHRPYNRRNKKDPAARERGSQCGTRADRNRE